MPVSRNERRGFTREFLRNLDGVERKAQSIRREFERRAAINHPDPEFRADPGDLESVLRSYAELGYDPQGYPAGWTGPRAVDGSWSPYATWEERPARRAARTGLQPQVQSPAVSRRARPGRRGKRVPATPDLVEHLICEAWQEFGPPNAGYAPLTDVRPRVQEYAVDAGVVVVETGEDLDLRGVVDATLIAMIKTGDAHLVPDSSWARNYPQHKAAAIKIGTEHKNWLLIEDDFFLKRGWRKRGHRWVR